MKGVCACTHFSSVHERGVGACLAHGVKVCVCPSYKEVKYPDRNPAFRQLMDELIELHNSKSHDYAQDDNVYSNFEFAANFANVTVMQVFDVLIGVKQARILELKKGKVPYNESLIDSYKDFVVYSALRACYHLIIMSKPDQNATIENEKLHGAT